MDMLKIVYYILSVGLWIFLAALWIFSLGRRFVPWLVAHQRTMIFLLGVNQLPVEADRILKKFYFFLAGGWTWILVWSWWLGPGLKNFFFHSVTTTRAYEIARISTLVVFLAYAAVGFFAIGRAISIWVKKIYFRTLPTGHQQQT